MLASFAEPPAQKTKAGKQPDFVATCEAARKASKAELDAIAAATTAVKALKLPAKDGELFERMQDDTDPADFTDAALCL
jgi:hypothetical protein